MFSLSTVVFYGCGESGSSGLNGAITVEAEAVGREINATATYTNPTQTNLIGTEISFSVKVGDAPEIFLGTFGTNNSGSVGITPFSVPAFNGTQTVTVFARTGNLMDLDAFEMTGGSLSVTAPAVVLTATSAQAPGSAIPFAIPAALITIKDPFSNNLGNRPLTISATYVSDDPSDTLTLDSSTATTDASGTANFSAQGTLTVPATVGGISKMTISWKVTDQTTGLTGSGTTTVTLTKTS